MKLQLPTLWHCSQGGCLAQREPRCCSLVPLYPGDHISQAPPGGTNLILKGPVSIFRGKPIKENYFCLQRPPCPSCSCVCLGSRMLSVPISFHGWVPISSSKNRHHPRVFLPPPVVVKPTLPLQNAVLSRLAWLLERQTGILKRWKDSFLEDLGVFWRMPLGRPYTMISSFQTVTIQSCLLQRTDSSHLTLMVAALTHFSPNFKVSLGLWCEGKCTVSWTLLPFRGVCELADRHRQEVSGLCRRLH